MNPVLLTLSLITCAVLCAGDAAARVMVVVFPAEIQESCAPWDGAARTIKVALPVGKFTADVYGRGLTDLSAGKAVTLDGGTSNDSNTGYGTLCVKEQDCHEIKATIELPSVHEIKAPHAQGTLTLPAWGEEPETHYMIKPVLVEAHPLCG